MKYSREALTTLAAKMAEKGNSAGGSRQDATTLYREGTEAGGDYRLPPWLHGAMAGLLIPSSRPFPEYSAVSPLICPVMANPLFGMIDPFTSLQDHGRCGTPHLARPGYPGHRPFQPLWLLHGGTRCPEYGDHRAGPDKKAHSGIGFLRHRRSR